MSNHFKTLGDYGMGNVHQKITGSLWFFFDTRMKHPKKTRRECLRMWQWKKHHFRWDKATFGFWSPFTAPDLNWHSLEVESFSCFSIHNFKDIFTFESLSKLRFFPHFHFPSSSITHKMSSIFPQTSSWNFPLRPNWISVSRWCMCVEQVPH